MAETVQVEGLAQVLANMQRLRNGVGKQKAMRAPMAKAARVIRDEARRNAPVKTGFLRDQIVSMRSRKPQAYGANELYSVGVKGGARAKYANTKRNRRLGRVGGEYERPVNAFYWRFQEFGVPTKGIRAQRFLRGAFETKGVEALQVFTDTANKVLDRLIKKQGVSSVAAD